MAKIILTLDEVRQIEAYWKAIFEIAAQQQVLALSIENRLREAGIGDSTTGVYVDNMQTVMAWGYLRSLKMLSDPETREFLARNIRQAKQEVPAATDPAYVKKAVQEMFTDIRDGLDKQ